jgi:site-specific recombinase XerD
MYTYYSDKKRTKLPKYLEKTVIEDMLVKAKKHRYRDYIILLTLWRTGMRISELVHLRKKDITDSTIIIRGGKYNKDRVIPLEKELGNLLGLYSDHIKHEEHLFKLTRRQIRNLVYRYRGKRENVSPHTFRHSFAVYCLKNGMNLESLRRILGHTNLNTTQVYLDLAGKDTVEDFNKIDWR